MATKGPPPASVGEALSRWAVAAVAASVAEAVTFPLDVTKTRLQLQGELGKGLQGEAFTRAQRQGMWRITVDVARTEGWRALYSGLPAAVLRQAVYGGIGVGLYHPVRALLLRGEDPASAPLGLRIAAGALTGGVGQLVAAPTDVVKVRLQADDRLARVGKPPRYRGTWDAFRRIPREEGLRGLYVGLGPSLQRAAVINGCGIASYDHAKQVARRVTGATEGLAPQVVGSLVSGLVSALVSTPLDVVKTRLMTQPATPGAPRLYSGTLDCFVKTARAEGLGGMYKGFTPTYTRLAPWQLVFFVAFEQANRALHGSTL
jgi:solute carrier family 25 uncoupling protein 27